MRQHDNDNEKLSFITLSAATLNVVRYLQTNEKEDEQSEGDSNAGRADEKKDREHREAVAEGLKRIRAFERRAAGKDRTRR